ncbi:hypothetical protein GCM10009804_06150 [Kribbella hippodromi]|uniref:Secreted protein n=1 Tax=Kribbella hippodromi TaxID=434347 RepID=A0ABN2C3J6_9ACTN
MPAVVLTVTGLSGCTAVAPLAGTIEIAAAASDGVGDSPGVVEAPGVLLCELDAPGVDWPLPPLPAFVSLQAVPASSSTQIPATARPCFLTEPLTIPQLSPV